MKTYIENLTEALENIHSGKIGSAALEQDRDVMLHLTGLTVGKSTFIYGNHTYYDRLPGEKLELLAVLTENLKVVFNKYKLFKSYNDQPEGYISVSDYIAELQENSVSLYNALPTENIEPEYIEGLKTNARYNLIFGKSVEYSTPVLINKNNILDILVGKITPEQLVNDYINSNRESIISNKSALKYTEKLMTEKSVVKPWELELSEILRNTEAKTVNVEFCKDGKTAAGKIKPNSILRTLANNSDFGSYDFSSGTEGRKIFAELNISWKNRLTCDDITQITYRGKSLFARTAEN